VSWALHVDLSRRQLVVRRDGRALHSFVVAIGSPSHPTPRGRFSVTDKLRVRDPGSPYGCCVLALTGHQTRLPADWPGGDRLAIHAAKNPSSIGQAVSLGCMRVTAGEARWLLRAIPLGTPIFIRS
jgi:lipoprotein-anchoring transpeptidase ErfK/SrfK